MTFACKRATLRSSCSQNFARGESAFQDSLPLDPPLIVACEVSQNLWPVKPKITKSRIQSIKQLFKLPIKTNGTEYLTHLRSVFPWIFVAMVTGIVSMFPWLQVVYLTWWPLFRDATYYTFTVVALIVVIFDEEVYWSVHLPSLLSCIS